MPVVYDSDTNTWRGRLNCVVPGCRRTADAAKHPFGTEIICGKCWKRVPSALKKTHRDNRRDIRMVHLRCGEGSPEFLEALHKQYDGWDRIKAWFEPTHPTRSVEAMLDELGLR